VFSPFQNQTNDTMKIPLCIQKILAQCDRFISNFFEITSSGSKGGSEERWVYFFTFGPRIAIVGTNGKIHRLTGYFAIEHFYKNGTLIKRVPVRKNLAEGERLATNDEIAKWQEETNQLIRLHFS